MAKIDAFFNFMLEQKASDLHLSSGNPPILRINGDLHKLDYPPLDNDKLKAMLQQGDLATWRPERPTDVIYSNAAFHWVGDHGRLFPALLSALAPGGVLAVQMPRNFDAPSHTLMHELAASPPWRDALATLLRPQPVLTPEVYYGLLAANARSLDIWETEYLQILEGENPVAEWTKGTWLAPLLAALAPDARVAFESEYRRRVAQAYPRQANGKTLFPFRRLFIVAGF